MDANDDLYGKELDLNCFYMPTNFEQKYPKTAIMSGKMGGGRSKNLMGRQ